MRNFVSTPVRLFWSAYIAGCAPCGHLANELKLCVRRNVDKKQKFDPYDKRVYRPFKIEDVATRPGCLTVLRQPSRMGGVLYYPDGRQTK